MDLLALCMQEKYSKLGWLVDNPNLEYIISSMEKTIDFVISNHKKI